MCNGVYAELYTAPGEFPDIDQLGENGDYNAHDRPLHKSPSGEIGILLRSPNEPSTEQGFTSLADTKTGSTGCEAHGIAVENTLPVQNQTL